MVFWLQLTFWVLGLLDSLGNWPLGHLALGELALDFKERAHERLLDLKP